MLHPYCVTGKTPQQRQQLSNTSVAAPKGTLTSLAGGGSTSNTSTTTGITGTTTGNNSANVGHPNKSKVMHDLFGIETTDSPKTTSSSSNLVASTSRYDYYCNNFWLVTTLDSLISKNPCLLLSLDFAPFHTLFHVSNKQKNHATKVTKIQKNGNTKMK